MEELIDSLDTLKIEKNVPYNLSKTGLIYNTDLFDKVESVSTSENIKQAFKKLNGSCLDECLSIKGRKLNDDEKKILTESYQNEKADSLALGSCLCLIDQIQDNSIDNGVVFLNSNNIEHSLVNLSMKKYGLKRVLLIDWDVNHNLKCQTSFYDTSKVLYFSTHRFDDGTFPNTTIQSNFDHIGEREGKGFNVNIPLNECVCGDSDFFAMLYNVLLPIAYEFNPEFIIIPTSFDMLMGSSCQQKVSPSTFGHFLHSLSCLANGKLLLLINGNNDSKLYTDCIQSCIYSLLGYPSPHINSLSEPSSKVVESILSCITVLRPYWICLQSLNESSSIKLDEFLQIQKDKLQNSNVKDTLEALQSQPTRLSPRRLNSKNGEQEIIDMIINIELNKPLYRTCICSDEAMMAHENLMMDHPEKPERIKRILEALKEKKLYERCGKVDARLAIDEELELTHDLNYVNSLKTLKSKTREELIQLSKNPDSVYFHFDTFECAKLAAGSVLSVVDAVCTNKFSNGVAISRPPGHHANSNACSGFCFFNSIAVAAKYAQKKYPSIKKILILDFDVHHGNGTQEIFKDDESVLFISLHRYDDGYFYPANALSNYNYIGEGNGKGFSVNIPWNQVSGDAEYIAAFLRIVMPVAYEFSPDLVLVSAGFDAALGDPLGGYKVTPIGYAQMTKMLCNLANGKVIMALEGGYNLNSISESMSSCVSALLGDKIKCVPPTSAKPKAYESIRNIKSALKPYWNCFKFDEKLPHCDFLKTTKQKSTFKSYEVIEIGPSEHSYQFRTRSRNISIKTEEKSSRNISSAKSNKSPSDTENILIETQKSSESLCIKKSEEITLTFCPHLHEIKKTSNFEQMKKHTNCLKLNDSKEDWICLNCFGCCACTKIMDKNMHDHLTETNHSIILTYHDLSIWCNNCNTYVNNDLHDIIEFTPRTIIDKKIEQ